MLNLHESIGKVPRTSKADVQAATLLEIPVLLDKYASSAILNASRSFPRRAERQPLSALSCPREKRSRCNPREAGRASEPRDCEREKKRTARKLEIFMNASEIFPSDQTENVGAEAELQFTAA